MRYATLLAVLAAIGEVIPLIGPIFSAVPAVIIASFQSPLLGLLTLGLYILVQQFENHLLVPKVMERAVALHPLAVIIALLAGSELLGVTGAVLSVPVAAAASVVIDEAHRERRQRQARKALRAGAVPPVMGNGPAASTAAAASAAPAEPLLTSPRPRRRRTRH